MAQLPALTTLKYLHLVNTSITGPGLNSLEGLSALTSLHFANSPISKGGLHQLGKIGSLRNLSLQGIPLKFAETQELLSHLPQIKELEIWDQRLGQAELLRLKQLFPSVTFRGIWSL